MSNRFQLIRRKDMKAGPTSLNQVDREICNYLGVEYHPTRYAFGWFEAIGLQLACGKTFDEIDRILCDSGSEISEELREINQWLAYHFAPDNRVEVGRSASHSTESSPALAIFPESQPVPYP
jgi:hypothetical protein